MKTLLTLFLLVFFTGCASVKPLKGGHSQHESLTGSKTDIQASENPQQPSRQDSQSKIETSRVIPAGSTIKEIVRAGTNETSREIVVDKPVVETSVRSEDSHITLGAAQHDDARKLAAGYMSVRWIQVVGLCMFAGGLAFSFIPYLRILTGSTTFGFALAGGGLGITFLAHAIVGNETLVILSVLAGCGIYLWIHRHGAQSAENKLLKDFIDKNSNGVDDREETNAKPGV